MFSRGGVELKDRRSIIRNGFPGVPNSGGEQTYAQRVLATSPLAYWILNESVGSLTAVDSTGNGHDGAVSGVVFGQTGIGDDNTSAFFDGIDDYIGNLAASLTGNIDHTLGTFMCWLVPTTAWNPGTFPQVFMMNSASQESGLYLDADITFYQQRLGFLTAVIAPPVPLDFANVICAWDAGNNISQIYLNGVAGTATTNDGISEAILNFWLGTNMPSIFPFDGKLAHCALWNRVLSVDEIASLAVL